MVEEIINKACKYDELNIEEIILLLEAEDEDLEKLFQKADEVRAMHMGNKVFLRGIIEFSNYCKRNCQYCGLRHENKLLKRYRLQPEEIVDMAVHGVELGYKTIVLQSGEDEYYDVEKITWIIKGIKKRADTAITLCLGEREYDEYKMWRKAGADRYLLKQETADENLYYKLHPGMNFRDRIKRLEWLKDLGYQVGSGNIIGLPGQTKEAIARDILLFKKLDLHMIGIGPFIAHDQTPLAGKENGGLELTLKTVAITRLLMLRVHLPATTALGTIHPYGREKALKAGANVVMPNITDTKYRPLYEIYPGKICTDEKSSECRQCIGQRITNLGREIGIGYGHSPKVSI